MCGAEDLFNRDFTEQLRKYLLMECGKFRWALGVKVPAPDSRTGFFEPCIDEAFVKFAEALDAKRAQLKLKGLGLQQQDGGCLVLSGRKFGDRVFERRLDY